MEFWLLITNLILFFNYDVILRVHASIVCVIFWLFCDISLTTYRRALKFTSNDAESTVSYKCSVDKKSLTATENKLYAKNGFAYICCTNNSRIYTFTQHKKSIVTSSLIFIASEKLIKTDCFTTILSRASYGDSLKFNLILLSSSRDSSP